MKNTSTLYFRAYRVYQAACPFLSPRSELSALTSWLPQTQLVPCFTLPPGNSCQHCSQRNHTSPLLRTSPRVGPTATQSGPTGPVPPAPSSLCPSLLFLPSSLLPFQSPWPPGSPKLSKPQNLSICHSLCLKTLSTEVWFTVSSPSGCGSNVTFTARLPRTPYKTATRLNLENV